MSRRLTIAFSFVVVVLAAVALAVAQRRAAPPPPVPQQPPLDGFKIVQVRFDESMGDQRPTPRIPRDWRFVAVSNGQKLNTNTLWFQDAQGAVYMLQGFSTAGKFVLDGNINRLEPGQ